MPIRQPPNILKLLAHDVRWSLVQALNVSDYRVHELVQQLDAPMNLISYHLKLLRESGLVAMHKSEADGRDVYYSLEIDALKRLLEEAEQALNPVIKLENKSYKGSNESSPIRVLFVCTHNSARSQIAEAMLRTMSGGKFLAFSAGSEPSGVHPDAIRAMQAINIDIRNQQSKHWSVFEGQTFDYVISVCDRVREVCPVFPGGQSIHWSFPDPVAITDEIVREAAFTQLPWRILTRIEHFITALYQGDAA